MQERKSPIVDSVRFTVIKVHSRTLATKNLLFLQREAVHHPWRRWIVGWTFGTWVGEGHRKVENLHVWTGSGTRALKEQFVLSNRSRGFQVRSPEPRGCTQTHTCAPSPGDLPSAWKLCCGFQSSETAGRLWSLPCLLAPPAAFVVQNYILLDRNITQGPCQFSPFVHTCLHKNKFLTFLSYNSPFVPFLMKQEAPGEALH